MKTIVGILLLGASIVSASEPVAVDRTLPVSGPVNLEVTSDAGGLIITAGSGNSVHVHAVIKSVYGRFDLNSAEANIRGLQNAPPIEQSGNRIRIGYVHDLALLQGVTIRFEIETPRATEVHAITRSGGIRISGVDGPVVSTTRSGRAEVSDINNAVSVTNHSGAIVVRGTGGDTSIRNGSGRVQVFGVNGSIETLTTSGGTQISDVSGDVRSSTHSGSISIDNAKGNVVAQNGSGSIDAFQLSARVEAQTTSGAIRISQIRPAAIRARADSGSIKVDLSDGGGYMLDAQSQSGKVSGPFRAGQGTIAHQIRQQIGAGGPLVDLDTNSSRIEIN